MSRNTRTSRAWFATYWLLRYDCCGPPFSQSTQWHTDPSVPDELCSQPELDIYEVQNSELEPSHPQGTPRRSARAGQIEDIYEVQYLQSIPDPPHSQHAAHGSHESDTPHTPLDEDIYEVQYSQPHPDLSCSQETQCHNSLTGQARGASDAANGAVT